MWWLFELLHKDDNVYTYSYSCDTRKLDGRIEYNVSTQEAKITQPCASDDGFSRAQERSLGKFIYHIAGDGFPEHKMIACG